MAMNYTSLLASKGTSGAISTWVSYDNIDKVTILEESQAIIYQMLRTREMKDELVFGVAVGQSKVALPARFLDPIDQIRDQNGMEYLHKGENEVKRSRSYQALSGGALAASPITTGAVNSSLFNVTIAAHGLSQGSDVTLAGLTSPVDGITVNGTFPVEAVVNANTITCSSPAGDQAVVGGVADGGAAGTWSGNLLIQSSPSRWSIWSEAIQFDAAADTAFQARLLYYRSKPLLSSTNSTNFLTSRYPTIMRAATMASASSYMKDDEEEQKWMQKLTALVEAANAESDLTMRGMIFGTDTPGADRYSY